MNGEEHRRGEGVSSWLCSYCCQPWPCPDVERATYGPPDPGGRTRDAREQIARALAVATGHPHGETQVDAFLALCPAIADALAAVERVRAFIDGFAERGGGKLDPGDELWIMSIRRELGGA